AEQILRAGDRLMVIAALPDLERLLRRDRPSTDWAVDVIAFPPSARSKLVQLLWERQSVTATMAEGLLDHLPFRFGNNLTRGQAEDLLAHLRPANVTARATQVVETPAS